MTHALILAGGRGMRLGENIPKQYLQVNNRTVISYCLEKFFCHPKIDTIQIIAAKQWHKKIMETISKYDKYKKFHSFSVPGENRQISIFHGLTDIKTYADDTDIVIIHDAARPLLSEEIISNCLRAVSGHDGVLPVLSLKDTVYKSVNGKQVSEILNRNEIYAGQAPEVFRLGKYYEANVRLCPEEIKKISGSTEPAIIAGMDVIMIAGDEENIKITTKKDLQYFRDKIRSST